MNIGALRALVVGLNFSVHGVPITVTPPPPLNDPITTSGIWLGVDEAGEVQPFGTDLRRREPRRILAIRRSAVTTMSRGCTIEGPELAGGPAKTWTVDGILATHADHWRVAVTLSPTTIP